MSYNDKTIKIEDGKTYIIKERMQDIVDEEDEFIHVVEDDMVDQSRWSGSVEYRCIFQIDNKYYRTYYSRGATESPFEYVGKWIEVVEVVQKEIVRTEFVKKDVE